MKASLLVGAAFILICGVGLEVGYLNGKVALLVVLASAMTALIFSMARKPEQIILSDYPGQDILEANVPGGGGLKLKGKNLPERLLGDRGVMLILICAVAWFMWWHHTTTEDLLKKNLEATTENTYVLSLSQAEREGLRITMPDSLKRKMRNREQ